MRLNDICVFIIFLRIILFRFSRGGIMCEKKNNKTNIWFINKHKIMTIR